MRPVPIVAIVLSCAAIVGMASPAKAPRFWGEHGHIMIGQAASGALPAEMPEFFRKAAPQLAYLNPEPDRWRNSVERTADPAMDGAHSNEHFVDFELIPGEALKAPHRYAFVDSLHAARMNGVAAGLLPYTMLEVWQRMRVGFRDWRRAPNDQTREWIQARIINDAGVLGHYVADGSNPHHTSVHHNGWAAGYANPDSFTTARGFHGRFEGAYVQAKLKLSDFQGLLAAPRIRANGREEIWSYLRESHSHLNTLYRLDKRMAFDSTNTSSEHKAFTAERLAAGATMLRDLWYTAWMTSEATGGR